MTAVTEIVPRGILEARVSPESFDSKKRTIEIVASTGAAVRRWSWARGYYEEVLSMDPSHIRLDFLNSGRAHFFQEHRQWDLDSVIGTIVEGSARIQDGALVCVVRFHKTERAEELMGRMSRGELGSVSVGYFTHEHEVIEREEAPDTRTAIDWEPKEVSLVPIGADPEAYARSAPPEQTTTCVLRGVGEETMAGTSTGGAATKPKPKDSDKRSDNPEDQRGAAPEPEGSGGVPAEPAQRAPEPQPVDPEAAARAAREAQKLERERTLGIQTAVRKAGLKPDLAEQLIRDGISLSEARGQIIDQVAEQRGGPEVNSHIAVGQDERSKHRDSIERALLHRFNPVVFPLEEGDGARSMVGDSLIELGMRHMGRFGDDLSQFEKDHRASILMGVRMGGLHSTSDFPLILANVANKSLRSGYKLAPKTFERLVRVRTATDFKEITSTQLGEASQLQEVAEGAEYTYGTIGEAAEKYRILKYGRILALTRETIINDDLDALTRIPQKMGVQAGRLESSLFWSIFTSNPNMGDGTPIWHASRGNVGTGAIAEAGLNDAIVAMQTQTALDGETELDIMPRFLIVPVARQITARKQVASTISPTEVQNVNPFSGMLQIISDPRLDKNSANEWFLACDPNENDSFELAYLGGNREPHFESQEGFDVDGMKIKIRHELGFKCVETRGLYKSSGV